MGVPVLGVLAELTGYLLTLICFNRNSQEGKVELCEEKEVRCTCTQRTFMAVMALLEPRFNT